MSDWSLNRVWKDAPPGTGLGCRGRDAWVLDMTVCNLHEASGDLLFGGATFAASMMPESTVALVAIASVHLSALIGYSCRISATGYI